MASLQDEYWMGLALVQAQTAAMRSEVPVGAVVVGDGDTLIAASGNASIAAHDASAHAEIRALRKAGRALQNYRLTGCDLYVTLEPCMMCVGAMVHARIARCVFGAFDPKTGAAGSCMDAFSAEFHNHRVAVTGGILADDCARILREFFARKRAGKTIAK